MKELYKIESINNEEGKIFATIIINESHKIFEGHFPGQPVLPGVCQIQIVKEMLEKASGKNLFLSEASQCKFLQMVDPTITKTLSINIDYSLQEKLLDCNAILKSDNATFLKMKAKFVIVE